MYHRNHKPTLLNLHWRQHCSKLAILYSRATLCLCAHYVYMHIQYPGFIFGIFWLCSAHVKAMLQQILNPPS